MQDIHAIGDRLFGGSGGDRRLRPHHHHQNLQALKCPRCDSLNTKFCYYNNYNLSQPRHFCKSCRRYWTKGGVLRNVPVGGGCRKNKRSKPKSSSSDASVTGDRRSNSHSSSESSSLTAAAMPPPPAAATATTAAATTSAAPEVASANSSASAASTLLNVHDARLVSLPQTSNPSFAQPSIDHSLEGRILPEIGRFGSLMTSSTDTSFAGFNMADVSVSAYRLPQQNHEAVLQDQRFEQQQELPAGALDRTAQMDLTGMNNRGNNGGLGALDWNSGVDHGLFDLIGTVDHAYWGQAQWTDTDQPLYLP